MSTVRDLFSGLGSSAAEGIKHFGFKVAKQTEEVANMGIKLLGL